MKSITKTPAVGWGKSNDGYAESLCGRYRIKPNFLGRTKAIGYFLQYRDPRLLWTSLEYLRTQRDCKTAAQRHRESK